MRRGLLLHGAVLLGVLLWGSLAPAQSTYYYLGFRMLNTPANPFRYYVDSRASSPAGIQLTSVETAVQNAFKTWDAVSCASTSFVYAGRRSTTPDDIHDRYSVAAVWVTSKDDPLYVNNLENGDFSIVAAPLAYGGYLFQCDILINGTGDFKWSTASTTPAGYLDLETYLLHAIGTCQGLDLAVDNPESVMATALPTGASRRALAQYDKDALCNRYPVSGAVSSPCGTSNSCTNGLTCVTSSSTGGQVDYPFCTKGCTNTTPGECPDPFECKPSTAVPGYSYACLPKMKDFVTQVGISCTADNSCGSAYGLCLAPVPLPSSGTAWYQGYCSEECTVGGGECASGSTCAAVDATSRKCLKNCSPGGTDCRESYTCAPLAEGNLCVPSCYGNADCGSGFSCRTCDHVCIESKNPSVVVGDPCTDNAQCGTGQSCLKFNGQVQGVCTQACGIGTCSCPEGASCQQVGGASVCVRGCSAGTCTTGLQCAPFSTGVSGCLPPCSTSADCPSGSTCGSGGQCIGGGSPDGGSCALCGGPGSPDAGTPVPTDGGTGSGGTSGPGCGCQGSAVSAPGYLGALAVFLVAARRRRCPRP